MSLLDWGSIALGAANVYTGYSASESQSDSINASTRVSEDTLDFYKEQYQHYLDVYGSAEQNLSEYYKSLTPEQYKTQGLDAYDTQFKVAQSAVEQQMAQRGLSGSGIEAESNLMMDTQAAADRANIVASSDKQWANDQMSWLGLGMGQGNVAAQGIASSSNSLASNLMNASNIYGQQASAAGQGVGDLISGMMYANSYKPGSINPTLADFTNIFK